MFPSATGALLLRRARPLAPPLRAGFGVPFAAPASARPFASARPPCARAPARPPLPFLPPHGARAFALASSPPPPLRERIARAVALARSYLPTAALLGGGAIVLYGSWRVLVYVTNSFLSLHLYDVFEYGFVAGAATVLLLGAGVRYTTRLTRISPDAAFRAALSIIGDAAAAERVLGTNIRGGLLKAYVMTPAHVTAHKGLAWVEPRIQLLFQIHGELGEAMVTAEAVKHRGALAFTVLAIDTVPAPGAPSQLLLVRGSEDKLHVAGTLRGFLQTQRATFIPLDRPPPQDEDLVHEQRKLEPAAAAAPLK